MVFPHICTLYFFWGIHWWHIESFPGYPLNRPAGPVKFTWPKLLTELNGCVDIWTQLSCCSKAGIQSTASHSLRYSLLCFPFPSLFLYPGPFVAPEINLIYCSAKQSSIQERKEWHKEWHRIWSWSNSVYNGNLPTAMLGGFISS